jgi:hypothetical protein
MKYFLHDSNAFEDEKVTLLYMEFGYEGLGLFYTILEKLAKQEKPIKTTVLKMQLNVGKKLEKCWNFMESIDIISSNNGETFNKQLLNFSEKYKIKKEKNLERIKQWRDNQEVTENVTHYESVCNAGKEKKRKENISKVKLSKVTIIDDKFEDWYLWYDNKKNKDKAQTIWNTLTEQEKDIALRCVKSYVESTPEKQYRKHPTTYLNQKSFNDEITIRTTNNYSKSAPKITDEQLHEAFIKRSSTW